MLLNFEKDDTSFDNISFDISHDQLNLGTIYWSTSKAEWCFMANPISGWLYTDDELTQISSKIQELNHHWKKI